MSKETSSDDKSYCNNKGCIGLLTDTLRLLFSGPSSDWKNVWMISTMIPLTRVHRTANRRVRCSLVRTVRIEQCEQRTVRTANSSFFKNRRTGRTVRTGANTVRWSLPKADCLDNGDSYTCFCRAGYEGDGYSWLVSKFSEKLDFFQ